MPGVLGDPGCSTTLRRASSDVHSGWNAEAGWSQLCPSGRYWQPCRPFIVVRFVGWLYWLGRGGVKWWGFARGWEDRNGEWGCAARCYGGSSCVRDAPRPAWCSAAGKAWMIS